MSYCNLRVIVIYYYFYLDKAIPTIGVDYRPVYGRFKGHFTKLMIWDTAGQEKFRSITMS